MQQDNDVDQLRRYEFRFKGNRNYLHGTDLYLATLNALEHALEEHALENDASGSAVEPQQTAPKRVSNSPARLILNQLSLRQFSQHQLHFSTEQTKNAVQHLIATGFYTLAAQPRRAFYWYRGDQLITQRYPYDETVVIQGADYDLSQQCAYLLTPSSEFHSIESIVTLNKWLLNQLSQPAQGQWIFGQLNLSRPLPIRLTQLTLQVVNLYPQRFAMSDIISNGHKLGQLRYLVAQPEPQR